MAPDFYLFLELFATKLYKKKIVGRENLSGPRRADGPLMAPRRKNKDTWVMPIVFFKRLFALFFLFNLLCGLISHSRLPLNRRLSVLAPSSSPVSIAGLD